jgi:AcrR family transcriptional regulator
MEKGKKALQWAEEGYNLFALEGPEGIQIERLARILNHNKSSFYHYFGDLDTYFEEVYKLHTQKVNAYLARLREIKTVEPEYFELLIEYKIPLMFQIQLTRIKNNPDVIKLVDYTDHHQDAILLPLWCQYLDVDGSSSMAMQYFNIVRHMFYSRVDFKRLDYAFLKTLIGEAKAVIRDLAEQKNSAYRAVNE